MVPSSSILSLLGVAIAVGQVMAQTQYACPADAGKTVVENNKKYELKCGQGIRGMPFEEEPSASIGACAQRCAAVPTCLHGTFIEKSKKCALKTTGELFDNAGLSTWYFVENVQTPLPSGGGGSGAGAGGNTQQPIGGGGSGTGSGGAGAGGNAQQPIGGGGGNAQEEDPANQASYDCPADQGKRYVTNGITYELKCNTGHSQGAYKEEPCPTLKECAARCARDPQCFSADWHVGQQQCAFKKAPAVLTPWQPGHAWWPTQCPKPRLAQANKTPQVATNLTCPQNDGKIFEGSDGTWFYLQCCADADGAVILDYKVVNSHKDCSEQCVQNKQCKSFMYVPGPAPAGGQANCRLYTNGNFSTTSLEGVHYAYVTDPPTTEAQLSDAKRCSTECPYADGQLYVSPTGENYLMSCKKRHGTTYLKIDRRPSFEACMSSCAAMPACQSADYEPRTKKCFYGSNTKNPLIAAEAFISAHSLGCSGACAGCKKTCDLGDAMAADQATCSSDHGKLLGAGGEDFRLYCEYCFRSSSVWNAPSATNLAECAKECAADTRCHGANWIPSQGCRFHPATDGNGNKPTFGQESLCHAVVPLDRSLADAENLSPHA